MYAAVRANTEVSSAALKLDFTLTERPKIVHKNLSKVSRVGTDQRIMWSYGVSRNTRRRSVRPDDHIPSQVPTTGTEIGQQC